MFARRQLIVEVIYAPLIGGSETLAFTLCKQWKSQGIATRICCLYEKQGELTALFDAAGLDYDLLDIGGKSILLRWWIVGRYLWKWRPRAVHVHHFGSLFNVFLPAALTGSWNVVYTEHSSLLIARTGWIRRAIPILSRFVRKVTCVSNKLVQFLGRDLGVPSRKLATVYNGVDTRRFHPRVGARAEGPLRVGAVGRLVEEKDYPMLLRAFALLKDSGVAFAGVIVGDGPLAAALAQQIDALGLRDTVSLYGRREDIPELMRDFDIYVLSSMSEGMPIAVLEAMATGLPIAATAVDAVPEVLAHEVNGLLVPKGDAAAMAAAIIRLAKDPELGVRLGEAALADVRSLFSIENATQLYAEYLGLTS